MQLEMTEKFSQVSKITIAITATFTAEPIEESLLFWIQQLNLNAKVEFSPYNQVFHQLLDPSSLLSQNQGGINVILVRLEDWEHPGERAESETPLSSVAQQQIEQTIQDLLGAIKAASAQSSTPQIIALCPASPQAQLDGNRQRFFQKMEAFIQSVLEDSSQTYVITPEDLANTYPVEDYYDAYREELGHVPYTPAFFTALGTLIARKIYRLLSPPYKVILLDCDNTLWKGVCGEDGAMGIKIDPPYKALQELMVAQQDAGMILGLCSKNIEADVFEVFENRPEMPLKREHFVSWRINWRPKSENIKSLAEELNLGLDSFIFIDDNPVECAEVQASCPEVLTLLLPAEAENIPQFLQHIWAFDHLKVTAEDKKRTELYKQNVQREKLRTSALTLGDFLSGLGLEVEIVEPQPAQFPRISQLTQRTNQFNFTTIRRSESEIQQLLTSKQLEALVTSVRDRFGDYGLVGTVLYKVEGDVLKVDTFLLSCRSLGRGVEHRMLAQLGKIAEDRHLIGVELPYIPTKKNQPALDFLEAVSSIKNSTEQGFCFQVPTEVAAAVTYQPAGERLEENLETSSSTNGVTAPQTSANEASISPQWNRQQSLIQIAKEFQTISQILQVIETQKRRARPDLVTPYLPPQTVTETVLASIWSSVLGIDEIGVNDNFFELGGHSLLVTQLISRIRDNFQMELSMQNFFESPTIAGLVNLLANQPENLVDADAISDLLKLVNELSEEEAVALLQEKTGQLLVSDHSSTATASDFQQTALHSHHYRIADLEEISIRAGEVLVYSRQSQKAKRLTPEVLKLLQECRQFKTLDSHARILVQTRQTHQNVNTLKNELAELARQGFLVSQEELLETCRQSEKQATSTPEIAAIGMITCNRIEGAKRALSSYIENSKKYGKQNEFVLMDDSANPQTRQGYRQMLQSLKKQYDVKIFYAGLEEKQKFAKALIKTGNLPEEVVNFALFDVEKSGASPGANRNALNLHTVGDMIFSADDDTVCRLVASPELSQGLAMSEQSDPSEYWVYSDRQTLLDSVSFEEQDLLALHEQLLGKETGTIISQISEQTPVNLNKIDQEMLRRLQAGDGKVLVTFNGLAGDCGWGAPFGYWGFPLGYLMLNERSHKRLVNSATDYQKALTSRDILRVVNQLGISDDSFGMTTFVGLDNRELLPPFLPVRRGQDLIFANTIWKCFNSFFGHLPYALLHEPVETRKFWPGEIFRTASGFDTAKLIIDCIKSCDLGPNYHRSAADNLRKLGNHLTEIGSLSHSDFQEFIRLQVWQTSRTFITLAETYLHTYQDSPYYWKNDLQKYIELLCQSLTRDDYFIPLDLMQNRDIAQAQILAQRIVFKFGQLLTWWPALVQVSQQLRVQGQRLGTLISE
jgi:FkbH-like protein